MPLLPLYRGAAFLGRTSPLGPSSAAPSRLIAGQPPGGPVAPPRPPPRHSPRWEARPEPRQAPRARARHSPLRPAAQAARPTRQHARSRRRLTPSRSVFRAARTFVCALGPSLRSGRCRAACRGAAPPGPPRWATPARSWGGVRGWIAYATASPTFSLRLKTPPQALGRSAILATGFSSCCPSLF